MDAHGTSKQDELHVSTSLQNCLTKTDAFLAIQVFLFCYKRFFFLQAIKFSFKCTPCCMQIKRKKWYADYMQNFTSLNLYRWPVVASGLLIWATISFSSIPSSSFYNSNILNWNIITTFHISALQYWICDPIRRCIWNSKREWNLEWNSGFNCHRKSRTWYQPVLLYSGTLGWCSLFTSNFKFEVSATNFFYFHSALSPMQQ